MDDRVCRAFRLFDASSENNAECRLNPYVNVIPVEESITTTNALDHLRPYDLVVDCTDRPYTRYLLSDAAVLLGKPLVSGAAIASAGQWAVYGGVAEDGTRRACYRCMWPRVVGDGGGRCDEIGVWGPVVGLVGVAMAGEVLALIIGRGRLWSSLVCESLILWQTLRRRCTCIIWEAALWSALSNSGHHPQSV